MDDDEYWKSEFETTKEFLKLCPDAIQWHATRQVNQSLNSHPEFPFTLEDKALWDHFIASNPILQRVIYYTYSPPNELETRFQMIGATADIARITWDADYIYFVLRYPELQDSSLLKEFLHRLRDDFSRVWNADLRKDAGAEGSIEELRANSTRCQVDGDGKISKRILDQSPWYRIEELVEKRQVKYYVLDNSPDGIDLLFSSADKDLIRWMQRFKEEEDLREVAYSGDMWIYILSKDGRLIKPPRGRRNPYPFALKPKYKALMEKTYDKYRLEDEGYREWTSPEEKEKWEKYLPEGEIRTDRRWDLEQIFKKAIMEWEESVAPPAYFKNALKWGFLNLEEPFRERFSERKKLGPEFEREDSKYILRDKIDFSGGSLDEDVKDDDGETIEKRINLLEGSQKSEDDLIIEADLSRFMDNLDRPADKIIFLDVWEAYNSPDSTHSSDAELARQLKAKGKNFTPQYIGKRRKKILADLQDFFED